MLKRYHITLGASTTAGGKVTSAAAMISINGAAVALEDDKVFCPACNSEGVIKLDGPRLTELWAGRHVALNDDLCICRCNPPPRLVNNQTFQCQAISAEQHLALIAATAAELAGRATAEASTAAYDDLSILLLHPDTNEPFAHRPYRLQLADSVIEGTTDANGGTRPLTADERAALVAWHVDGVSGAV